MTDDNFRTIGKHQPRYDGTDKITGVARYAADLEIPGMLKMHSIAEQWEFLILI